MQADYVQLGLYAFGNLQPIWSKHRMKGTSYLFPAKPIELENIE
jgi:hypothetical protein